MLYYANLILVSVISFFIILPFLLLVLGNLTGRRNFGFKEEVAKPEMTYGCIITVYKNLDISIPLIKSLLNQEYPNLEIVAIADQCKVVKLPQELIEESRLKIIYPEKSLNSKVRAIDLGLQHISNKANTIVVFDPDNLVPNNFFKQLNTYFLAGYNAVQGRRVAKNLDTTMANLDAAGEFYKNYVDREMPFRLGSSATISGSGMAIKRSIFESYMQSPEIQSNFHGVILGEDKILHNHIVNQGHTIAYAWEAIIYDEKVEDAHQVERQRTRWINTYFQNTGAALKMLMNGLMRFSWNKVLFGLISISPPLFILMFAAFFMALINVFINPWVTASLVLAVFIFSVNFLLTLSLSKAPSSVSKSMLLVPMFIFAQIKSLLGLKKSKNDFLVTESKKVVHIEDVKDLVK